MLKTMKAASTTNVRCPRPSVRGMTDLAYIKSARGSNNPIASLTDGIIAAKIAAENYELMVISEISVNPWKIESKVVALNCSTRRRKARRPSPGSTPVDAD